MIYKSIVGVQARSSSTRLPGKVLADLEGRSLIMRVVERLQSCALVDAVVVLTSTEASDDALADHLQAEGVLVRRGPLQDVMARYLALVEEFRPQYLVRVTGDCPLLEPHFIDLQLGALAALDADFVSLRGNEGGDFEGTLGGQSAMSARALISASKSSDPRDREHVGSFYFTSRREQFRFVEVQMDAAFRVPGMRLCVDEPADLEFVRRIFAHFGNANFSTQEALEWLAGEQELCALNALVQESQDNQARKRLACANPIQAIGQWP